MVGSKSDSLCCAIVIAFVAIVDKMLASDGTWSLVIQVTRDKRLASNGKLLPWYMAIFP